MGMNPHRHEVAPMTPEEARAAIADFEFLRTETVRTDHTPDGTNGPRRETGRRVHAYFERIDGTCPSDRDLDAFRVVELARDDTAVVARVGLQVVVNTYLKVGPTEGLTPSAATPPPRTAPPRP